MNKTELIAAMAEASGLSKKDCEAALAAFITTTENVARMCKTRLTSLRDYCIIKLLRAFTHVVKALIFLLLTESSGCIQCLLLNSISHELPKRNGCHDLKDWPEGQHADQQLCFIILVISECDSI